MRRISKSIQTIFMYEKLCMVAIYQELSSSKHNPHIHAILMKQIKQYEKLSPSSKSVLRKFDQSLKKNIIGLKIIFDELKYHFRVLPDLLGIIFKYPSPPPTISYPCVCVMLMLYFYICICIPFLVILLNLFWHKMKGNF